MSCAALWLQQWGSDGSLQLDNTQIRCRALSGKTWVGFAPLATRPCAVPDWLPGLLGVTPLDCAEAGSADGYLVVRLGEEQMIDAVRAPGDELTRHSQRALIVTRHGSETGGAEPARIQLRYFAPQYGEAEDTATGSAMRVLADYWQKQGLGEKLEAQQFSATGGVLFSHIDEDVIWIGGNVAEQPQAQESA
ncbi:MAG: hypothetical protein Hals2KO_38570 [Halioglobus sp.]